MKSYIAAFLPESDGGYSVLFPDLPGCQTCGDSMQEAFSMAVDALDGFLRTLADDNDPIPDPSDMAEVPQKLAELCHECGIELPDSSLLQLVPAPDLNLSTVRISISLRKYALDMIDRKAKEAGMTRGAFLVEAAGAYEPVLP